MNMRSLIYVKKHLFDTLSWPVWEVNRLLRCVLESCRTGRAEMFSGIWKVIHIRQMEAKSRLSEVPSDVTPPAVEFEGKFGFLLIVGLRDTRICLCHTVGLFAKGILLHDIQWIKQFRWEIFIYFCLNQRPRTSNWNQSFWSSWNKHGVSIPWGTALPRVLFRSLNIMGTHLWDSVVEIIFFWLEEAVRISDCWDKQGWARILLVKRGFSLLQNPWQLVDLHQIFSQQKVNSNKHEYFGLLCTNIQNIQIFKGVCTEAFGWTSIKIKTRSQTYVLAF